MNTELQESELALTETNRELDECLDELYTNSSKSRQILRKQVADLKAQNRKMRLQVQKLTEDVEDKDAEIEDLKFQLNSKSGVQTEIDLNWFAMR